MRQWGALCLVLLAAGALAGPAQHRPRTWATCATSCVSANKIAFLSGHTHVYEYAADVETTLAGATDEASRLHLTATAEVTANSGCDLTLQLREVTLKDSDPKNVDNKQEVENMARFRQELERFPLSFSFQDGEIDSLCSHESEPVWVLNIKRGLLSTFVNSMPTLHDTDRTTRHETDVTGGCPTEYTVTSHGTSILVTKSRDLLACTGRGHLISALQTTPYSSYSKVQSLPLLRSTLNCDQKVTDGRITSVQCRESHLFRPFSRGESGAVTRTVVRLTETAVHGARPNYDEDVSLVTSTLEFDHSDPEVTTNKRVNHAVKLLTELQQKTSEDVRPDVPRLFTRLVNAVRHLDAASLTELNSQVMDERRRHLLDALPLASTAPAMKMMSQLMRRGEVTDATADRWMTALAFVHEPTLEMVAAVGPLVTAPEARRQTLLGVSSMVHHYCQNNDCSTTWAVRSVVESLERRLGDGCRTSSEEHELQVLTALKALGNVGRLTSAGADLLGSCFENDNLLEVRMAAIKAFRRMPCSLAPNSRLMVTFANQDEDTEMRIAAYMVIMQCPSTQVVDKVQEILSGEEVNQVSSFVWSHLTNMQETRDPTKLSMKRLLYNMDLAKKFNSDMRKFSRYFEKTMFSSSMNAGATVDANVVFTPESYIPRSGMLNFTVDLFGQAINLLEVGGRVEGLEDFSESLFGNNGIYPQEAISQIMKTMRGRRSNDLVSGSTGSRIQTTRASTYMKIFGNELKFNKFDSMQELMQSLNCNGPLDFLKKLAKDMDWTENYQFLDSTYTIPTIVGFPFSLKAVGSAAISLKTGGSFDIQSWKHMNINGHIKPSAAIEIESEMTIDAHVAHTGLKMNTNFHTSTVFDGHAIVDTGKVVSVRINMPRDKVEVLDINTRFHSVFRNVNRKLELTSNNRFELETCSDSYFSNDLLGVKFCADMLYTPSSSELPIWPLSGPMTARFTIEKTDTIKAFQFEYHHSNDEGVRKSSLTIDTPGSSINRHLNFNYMIDFENDAFQVAFQTPVKSADLSGSLSIAGSTKKTDISLKIDSQELFGLVAQLGEEDTPMHNTYFSSINVRYYGNELATADGALVLSKGKLKHSVNLVISNIFKNPAVFRGAVSENDGTYVVTTAVESYLLNSNTKSTLRPTGDNLLVQINTDYSLMGGPRETAELSGKLGTTSNDDVTTGKAFMDVKFSAIPVLNSQLLIEHSSNDGKMKTQLVLTRGERSYLLTLEAADDNDKLAASVGFLAQHWDVDLKLGGSVDCRTKSKVTVVGEARLNQQQFMRGVVSVDYKNDIEGFNYGVASTVTLPDAEYTLTAGVRREEHAGHLKLIVGRDLAGVRDELALVTLLSLTDEQTGLELALSVPHYQRIQLQASLVGGHQGVYMARGTVQYGSIVYSIGGELRARTPQRPEHVLKANVHTPRHRYSAELSADVAGLQPHMKADLRFGRRILVTLQAQPYIDDMSGNFEIFWNKDVDETEKATFDVVRHFNVISALLKYPGRTIKMDATFVDSGITANLQYEPDKVVHVELGVEDRFSEGLRAFVNMATPFDGYKRMALVFHAKPATPMRLLSGSFEMTGTLEQHEIRLSGKLVDGIRRSYSTDTDTLTASLTLTTPFRFWERSGLEVTYSNDGNNIQTRLIATKNEDTFSLGGTFDGVSSPQLFKIHTLLDVAVPLHYWRSGKLGFNVNIEQDHLDTSVMAQWTDHRRQNELSLGLTGQRSVVYGWPMVNGTLVLKTPFENYEQLIGKLKIDTNNILDLQFDISNLTSEIFHTDFGVWYNRGGKTITGKFLVRCMSLPGFDISYMLNRQNDDHFTKYEGNIVGHWIRNGRETADEYSFSGSFLNGLTTGTIVAKREMSAILKLPSTTYEFVNKYQMDMADLTANQYIMWRKNSHQITWSMDMTTAKEQDAQTGKMKSITITGNGKLTSPFENWKSAQLSQVVKVSFQSDHIIAVNSNLKAFAPNRHVEVIDTYKFIDAMNWQVKRELNSNSRWVSHSTMTMEMKSLSDGTAEFTYNTNWDGDTAELKYSHVLPVRFDDSLLKMSATAKWFGGISRNIKLNVPITDDIIKPSLSLHYASGKTMLIYGNVPMSLTSGESRITLEAPFTEKLVITINHKFMANNIQLKTQCLHGTNMYGADVEVHHQLPMEIKVDVEFVTPYSCLGTGSASFEYELNDEIELRGKVSRNDWEITLNGKGTTTKGKLLVKTPYREFTTLSAEYDLLKDSPDIRLKRENRQILITFQDQSTPETTVMSLRVNTPYYRYEAMQLSLTKPAAENTFTIEYTQGRHASAVLVTDYHFAGLRSSVSVNAQTSFAGLSTATLELGYDLMKQMAKAMFENEGRRMGVVFQADINMMQSTVSLSYDNTLIFGPKQLVFTCKYDLIKPDSTFELGFVMDNDRFSISGKGRISASSLIEMDVVSPINGFKNMKFRVSLDLADASILLRLYAAKERKAVEVRLNAALPDYGNRGKAVLILNTPFTSAEHIVLSADYDIVPNPASAKLSFEKGVTKYDIIATVKGLGNSEEDVIAELTTPFTGLEKLRAEAKLFKTGDKTTVSYIFSRNQDKILIDIDSEFSILKSLIAFKIESPFTEARLARAIFLYDLESKQKNVFGELTRNSQTLQISASSIFSFGVFHSLIEMKTPYSGWENINAVCMYNFMSNEKSMEMSYEINGRKIVIAGRGAFSDESAYIDVITPIEGYETMGVSGTYVSQRGKREAAYDAHVNDHRHRLYVMYERDGWNSAKLKMETPFHDMHLIEVDVRSQEFLDGTGYYINTNRDGKRTTAQIRTVRDDNNLGVDVSVQSYLTGLENLQLSGNVQYRGKKRMFSLKSNRGGRKAEISGDVTLKRRTVAGSLKAVLPYEGFEHVDLTFSGKHGGPKKTFTLRSVRNGVAREFSGDLQYTRSSFAVNLNTPYDNFKKLHADASRTQKPNGKIEAEINLQRGNRKISVRYDYLFSSESGSGKIEVDTPYEGFYKIKTSLDYAIRDTARSITFKASRDAREWGLKTSRSWENDVDVASLDFSSPIDEIKTVKIARTFNIRDLSAMTYEGSYERNGRRFAISGTGSIRQSGYIVDFDVTVTSPRPYKTLTATVKYNFSTLPKTISARFAVGNRYASLEATINKKSGSATIETTNPMLRKLDINYTAHITSKKRDLNVTMRLADERQLKVVYASDFTKKNQANGKLKVTSTTYGDRTLEWEYKAPRDDYSGSLIYKSPNLKFDGSLSVDGKQYVRRKIVLKTSITSEYYTSTQTTTVNYNMNNGAYIKGKLNYNGKLYNLIFDAKRKAGKRIVEITYDGQILKGIKIAGSWTIPRRLEGRKEFDIKYQRGARKGSLKGFVSISSSFKSGSYEIDLKTPIGELKKLKVKGSWDMVLPTRKISVLYNRNGKRFSADLVGSRDAASGNYTLSVSMPPVKISPGKKISEVVMFASFDLSNGYKFSVGQRKPMDEKLEFDWSYANNVRTLKLLYHFHDVMGLANRHILETIHIEIDGKRTIRPNGPKIEVVLQTSFPGFERVTVDVDVNRGPETSTVTVNYRRGDKVGSLTGTVNRRQDSSDVSFNLRTPIAGLEEITASGSYTIDHGKNYVLNVNYARGPKYVRLTSSLKLNIQQSYGQITSGGIDIDFKLESYVTYKVDLKVTVDGSVTTQPRRSGQVKLVGTFNGKTVSVDYAVSRADVNRRTAKMVINTPLNRPWKKITYTADVSLAANNAAFSLDYGRKKITLDLSWFAGEAGQYGADVRLSTPYKPLRSLELDVKGTVRPDHTVDVIVHYMRGQKMVHVTGTLRAWAADLDFVTPTYGDFNVKAGFSQERDETIKLSALYTGKTNPGHTAGATISIKLNAANDMRIGADIRLPIEGWRRLNAELAYTNIQDSNLVRLVFESPLTRRLELSVELTNHTDSAKTDFRAGVTTNYLGQAFTFNTNILRDEHGMKYELEIESPIHLVPSFKLTGRR